MQLQNFALLYASNEQVTGQLLRCTFRAQVVDWDNQLHQFVVTDAYESARVIVGDHFLTLEDGQEVLSLALRPIEGPGRHVLTVAIDGERQAGRLVEFVP